MPARFSRIRRFRFNRPQQIAAGLLVLFLLEGLWRLMHLSNGRQDLFLRLFSLACGVALGGGLWWVARRQFGNPGGYLALALYVCSPGIFRASVAANPNMLAALGLYGGIYTSIGVAHAMQGPRRKWRPRIVLLTAAFSMVALANPMALSLVALLGLGLMLWIAEGRRRLLLPIVLIAVLGALLLLVLRSVFVPALFAFNFPFHYGTFRLACHFFHQMKYVRFENAIFENAGITLAALLAAIFYLCQKRARYFGNTAPLLCAMLLMLLSITGVPAVWALPFLLTFAGGVFADAFETARGRLAVTAASGLILLQAWGCCMGLAG